MAFLSKETELINFINSKILTKKEIEYDTILYYFVKVMKDSILRSHNRLNDIVWLQECTIIVFNIFWTIFCYTFNIKLTMFLCERAVLLFNEYIDLAKNTFKENNTEFKINSTDVKLFIYKRTIGPIKLKKKKSKTFNKNILKIKEASISLKNILNNLAIHLITLKQNLDNFVDYFENLIPDIYYKLYKNDILFDDDSLISILNNCSNSSEITQVLNKFKLDCEILYYIFKTNKKSKYCQIIFNKLTYNNELNDISNHFFNIKNYNILKKKYYSKKTKLFRKLIKNKQK